MRRPRRVARRLRILDPAVGSGAFLLGALEPALLTRRGQRLGCSGRSAGSSSANLFGVDRNGAAVRLTELRLWLAVIADDRTERPGSGVSRSPTSTAWSVRETASSIPSGPASGPQPIAARASELAALRRAVVTASGPEKQALLRALARAETGIAELSLARRRSGVARRHRRVSPDRRARADLFGERRGLDPEAAERLAGLRRELRQVRSLRRALAREGEVPWFDYRIQFADVFAAGGFDLVVGNPPWLRAEELPRGPPAPAGGPIPMVARREAAGYANRPDLAVAFLERSLELAAPGGRGRDAGAGQDRRRRLWRGRSPRTRRRDDPGRRRRPDRKSSRLVRGHGLSSGAGGPKGGRAAPPPGARCRSAPGLTVPQSSLRGGAPWLLGRRPLRDALAAVRPATRGSTPPCPATSGSRPAPTGSSSTLPRSSASCCAGRSGDGISRPFRPRRRTRLLWTHGARRLTAAPPAAAGRGLPRTAPAAASLARRLRGWAAVDAVSRARAAAARHRVVWADLASGLRAASLTGLHDTIPLNSCYVALTAERRGSRSARRLAQQQLASRRRAGRCGARGRRMRPLHRRHRRRASAPRGVLGRRRPLHPHPLGPRRRPSTGRSR